jgi:hypothetical protein
MSEFDRLTNLELNFYNNSSTSQLCRLSQTFPSELFPNSQNETYDMAVTRFRVSITEMDLIIIDDTTDYTIEIEAPVITTIAEAGGADPNYVNRGTANLQLTSINRILSPSDYIEYVNRALARAHRDMLGDWQFASSTVGIDNAGFNSAGTFTRSVSSLITGTTECFYVKMTLDQYQLISTNTYPALINIDLINPSGTVARVAAGIVLEPNKKYTFHNGGIRSFNQSLNRETNTLDNTYDIAPLETFLKFKDETLDGNWSIRITPAGLGSFNFTLKFTITLSQVPTVGSTWKLPNQPPVVNFDADGFLTWSFPERFLHNNMRIKLGNALKQSLNLNKIALSRYVELPIVTLSDNLDQIVNFKQECPKLYSIVDVEKIDVVVEGISMDRDILNGGSRSNALTSFMIPKDKVIDFTELEFVTDAGTKPWRRYRLDNSTGISSFEVSINAVYKDGTSRALLIEPYHSFNCMLSFFANA